MWRSPRMRTRKEKAMSKKKENTVSKNYEKIKRYYDEGRWNIEQVAAAVMKGLITIEEYYLITGTYYEVP